MSYFLHPRAFLLSTLLVAPACSDEPPAPAQLTVINDLSSSTPLSSDKAFANRAASKVAEMIGALKLGDSVVLFSAGERSWKGRQRLPYKLTPQKRHRSIIAQVGSIIASSPDSELSNQSETALTYAIEQSDIQCQGRGHLVLITDGIEARRGFNHMDDVIAGNAELPKPPADLLRGCKVTMLGIGILADDQPQLNNEEMRNLKAAWRAYFRAAGVADADIDLVSIF